MENKVFQHWIFVVHLLFWCAHWSVAFLGFGNLSWNGFSTENNLLYVAFAYGIISNMVLFYWQYFVAVPFYFVKNEFFKFFVVTIVFFFVISGIEGYLDYYYTEANNIIEEEYTLFDFTIIWLFPDFIFNVFYMFLGFLFRFPLEYFKSEKKKQDLQKETHHSELKYLKAQLNPHFLFNGINSIYHLIDKNSILAKNTLLRFSDLLRYQLYESNSQKIALSLELDYISKYIEIEKIRKGGDITLAYEIFNVNENQQIAPLLLIPFIENAFKHISSEDDSSKNLINIKINEADGRLRCYIENTFDATHTKKISGIGLQNVQRRLALLYKGKYDLQITKSGNMYIVFLEINL